MRFLDTSAGPSSNPVPRKAPCLDIGPLIEPPAWVGELIGGGELWHSNELSGRSSGRFALVSLCLPHARQMDGDELERAAAQAYLRLAHHLQRDDRPHPVRIWNHVPNILGDGGGGLNRYMRFNAGRYQAYLEWFGGPDRFDQRVPAASAVGHPGDGMWIHVLACREPGTVICNPRQHPPHCYSKRFGPLPPCFSRAMCVRDDAGRTLLMAGGTASIRGEDSVHVGDLNSQLSETLENLAAVSRQATAGRTERAATRQDLLRRFSDLRVYYVRESARPAIHAGILEHFTSLRRIEWIQADLCRPDLLVEIEGLAIS